MSQSAANDASVWSILADLTSDHPMWIDSDGEPLDYSPTREARIANFVRDASNAIAAAVLSLANDCESSMEWIADGSPEGARDRVYKIPRAWLLDVIQPDRPLHEVKAHGRVVHHSETCWCRVEWGPMDRRWVSEHLAECSECRDAMRPIPPGADRGASDA